MRISSTVTKVAGVSVPVLTLMLASLIPVSGGGSPSVDPAEPVHLIGGERLVYQFDADDLDNRFPGSIDDVGGSGDGRLVGTPERVAAPDGRGDAIRFSGDDHVRIDDVSALEPLNGTFTMTSWVKKDTTAGGYLFSSRLASGHWSFEIHASGDDLHVAYADQGGAARQFTTFNVLPLGQWVHVAVTFDGRFFTVTVNGEGVTAFDALGDIYHDTLVAGAELGKRVGSLALHVGEIDEFRVYGRLLTNAEIRLIMDFPYFHPNSAPQAVAGEDVAVSCTGPLTEVALDGTGSSDPEGDGLTFSWGATEGTFGAPDAAITTAEFPVGVSEAWLEVSDQEFVSNDTVRVHVLDGAPPVIGSFWPSAPGVYAGETGLAGGDKIVLAGPTTFRAEAQDQCGAVAAVRFSVDDGTVVEDGEAPFSFAYAPQGVGLQYRIVRIVAFDDQGNASPAVEIPVTVLALAPQT